MKKRIGTLLLCAVMSLTFAACGSKDGTAGSIANKTQAAQTAAEKETKTTETEKKGNSGIQKNADGFYEIYSIEDFLEFRDIIEAEMQELKSDINAKITASACLMDDIDFSSVCGPEIGSWRPIGWDAVTLVKDGQEAKTYRDWNGCLEGNGHTISGLYVSGQENGGGLFWKVYEGEVRNLVFSDCEISAYYYAGTVSGYLISGVISNVTVESDVTVTGIAQSPDGFPRGEYIGGIVGNAECRNAGDLFEISNCVNKGTVTGTKYVGGIVGELDDQRMKYATEKAALIGCRNEGNVIGENGKFVGELYGISTREN